MFKRTLIAACALVCTLALAAPAMALFDSYQYISPEALKAKIDNKEPMHLVDIQVEDEYSAHHIKGSIPTHAYPVKTDGEKAKLTDVLKDIKGDDLPVVIVCPRGGGGAKRCYEHFEESGVSKDRLFILEKGQAGWPYSDYLE